MADENNNYNLNKRNSYSNSKNQNNYFNNTHENKFSNIVKNKNVEPRPESSCPRRDGPGGENGD